MVTQLFISSIQYFIDSLDEGMGCVFIKSAKIKSVKSGYKYMGDIAVLKTFDNLDKFSIKTGTLSIVKSIVF